MYFKSILVAVSFVATFLFATHASAIPLLTFESGKVSGVSGLDALGSIWDISFHDGTFNNVGSFTPPFTNETDTQIATSQLTNFLESTAYNRQPLQFSGCIHPDECNIATLWDYNLGVLYLTAAKVTGIAAVEVVSMTLSPASNYTHVLYAEWTPSMGVPEPSVIWLLGSGLALIGFARHKA